VPTGHLEHSLLLAIHAHQPLDRRIELVVRVDQHELAAGLLADRSKETLKRRNPVSISTVDEEERVDADAVRCTTMRLESCCVEGREAFPPVRPACREALQPASASGERALG
jgi:hypothetical protein